ncbi:MAG TPA: aminotransferase class V-fold PLP-dependent enzyme [Humisphaera sp.]
MFGEINTLVGDADAFPVLNRWAFFNHAGVCPLPAAAGAAFRRYAQEAEAGAYLATHWYQDIEKLRVLAGELINAHRDEVAFVKNTSEGISTVAHGLDWQWGDRVVSTDVEYPANVYPWMEQVRARGVKLVRVPEETDANGRRAVPLERILEEAAHPKTKIVALSHVEYASGQRHDLARIGRFCRDNGKLFCVDAIQSVGVLPVDVKEMNIDYLSADGHKWMLGPEGAGIFYCRRELIERTRPSVIGWMNVVDAQNYGDINYTLRADAQRFEAGSYNVPGLLALKASLELIAKARVGAVAQRVRELGDLLIGLLERKGYAIVSPRDKWQWSGIVSFTSPTHDMKRLVVQLRKEHQVEIAIREGRLRASPHFYNTEAQIERLAAVLPGH